MPDTGSTMGSAAAGDGSPMQETTTAAAKSGCVLIGSSREADGASNFPSAGSRPGLIPTVGKEAPNRTSWRVGVLKGPPTTRDRAAPAGHGPRGGSPRASSGCLTIVDTHQAPVQR